MKIIWDDHSFNEAMMVIDDIVGLALHFTKTNHPMGEFPDGFTGGGFLYSLFVTWQRAIGENKIRLFPVMQECIDQYDVATKVQEIRTNNPEAARMSMKFLKEHGVIKFGP